MTDRDALREAAEHALEWFDTYLPDTDLQREMAAALAQPAEPGLSPQETFDELWTRTATLAEARGLVLEEVTRGWDGAGCLAATIQPDGTDWRRGLEASGDTPTAALTNLAARLRAEPGLDAGHYPGCDRNPCRCAGVTTKPGLDALRSLSDAATPGPWRQDTGVHDNVLRAEGDFEWIGVAGRRHDMPTPVFSGQVSNRAGQHVADAAFIAAAVNYVRARLRAEPGLDAGHYPGCDRNPCRCAGVTTKPGLTEAWARVDAALPEGHHLCDLMHDREGWTVGAYPHDHSTDGHSYSAGVYPTPAAALIALAEKLEAEK